MKHLCGSTSQAPERWLLEPLDFGGSASAKKIKENCSCRSTQQGTKLFRSDPILPSLGHPLLKRSSTGLEMTGLRKSFFLPRLTKTKRSQVFLGQSGGKICLGCSRFPSGKIGSKLTKFDCCPAVNSGLRSCNLPSSAQIKKVSKGVPL